jgi:hypothetical protein
MDTTPKPSFLRAIQNQKWTVAGALSELVDNSFGPGRGNASTVWIDHDATNRVLSVCDDGQGMDHVGRLFCLGDTIGRAIGDIGEYGSGGTMAILWLATSVDVCTLRGGQLMKHARNWPQQFKADGYFVVPDEWRKAKAGNTPVRLLEATNGTLIVCRLLKERQFLMQNVIRDLQNNYAPGLRSGKKIIWRTIKKGCVTESHPLVEPYPEFKNSIDFDFVLDTGAEHLAVSGKAGIVDELPYAQSKMSIGYGHRVICTTRECYQKEGAERFSGTGVCGWIDLHEGWQSYLSTTKDAINDGPVWHALMGHLYDELSPLLESVSKETLRILFDDLQLSLQTSINDLSSISNDDWREHAPINVIPIPGPRPPGPNPEPRPPGPDVDDRHKQPGLNPGDDAPIKAPAQSQLIVVECTDKEMKGTLCGVTLEKHDVVAQVNREHPWVEEALKAKPVNRKALLYLIVREIAAAIADQVEFQKRLFPKKTFLFLQGVDVDERERHITRFLLDKAA